MQPIMTQKSKEIWATLDLDLNVAKGKRGIDDKFLRTLHLSPTLHFLYNTLQARPFDLTFVCQCQIHSSLLVELRGDQSLTMTATTIIMKKQTPSSLVQR